MSEKENPDLLSGKGDSSQTPELVPESQNSSSSTVSLNRKLALMRLPNMPAALNFTSKTQVNSPASHENDSEGLNSIAIESNEVPLKPKRGRNPGNKENVESSKKRQRSSSTGLQEELEVFALTRF